MWDLRYKSTGMEQTLQTLQRVYWSIMSYLQTAVFHFIYYIVLTNGATKCDTYSPYVPDFLFSPDKAIN
jgi:hypothetical protein